MFKLIHFITQKYNAFQIYAYAVKNFLKYYIITLLSSMFLVGISPQNKKNFFFCYSLLNRHPGNSKGSLFQVISKTRVQG